MFGLACADSNPLNGFNISNNGIVRWDTSYTLQEQLTTPKTID